MTGASTSFGDEPLFFTTLTVEGILGAGKPFFMP